MKHDDNLSDQIDPELEARIVAWVLGEASPFEAAQLERLVKENPALAIFQRRIEAAHGLIGEAAQPVREPLLLSPERRAKLLAVIGAPDPTESPAPKEPSVMAMPSTGSKKRSWIHQPWLWSVASCLMIGFFLSIGMHDKSFAYKQRRDSSVRFELPVSSREEARPMEIEARAVSDTKMRRQIAEEYKASSEQRSASVAGAGKRSYYESSSVGLSRQTPAAPPSSNVGDEKELSFNDRVDGNISQNYEGTSRAINPVSRDKADSPKGGFAFNESQSIGAAAAAGKSEQDQTIVLSPFTISASEAQGYIAQNTLARTRVNTELKDISSPISVVTQQFLQDTGATNSTDQLVYDKKTGLADKIAQVQADLPVVRPAARLAAIDESLRAEIAAATQPFSTFSLHVSDVSFRLAKAALDRGERPDPASIRPEEFYNAFDYGDPSPAAGEPVVCRIEQAAHPFLQQRNLVRIAMKVPATGRDAGQPLRLTVLLDTSGSMEREDRTASVHRAMEVLISLLGANDRITLIGFARQPHLLADRVPGDEAAKLLDIIGRTPAEGGTNLEEALKLAGEHARAQFTPEAQNRIVVLSDGAANLGNDDPAQLSAQVEKLRQQGIAFDACGVGADGLDDSILEALTRKGDGRYYVINSPGEADAGFAHQLAGAFRPAAQNVKVQVRFNPARVRSYRLIGFEQHRLRQEDFRNDKVDAAELAAEEAAVALYQVEVLPEGEGELGDVFVRFRNTAATEMVERSWTLAYAPQAPAFDRATPSMQLAGTSALLAEKLRGGELAAQIRPGELAPVVNALRAHYANEPRVQELVRMFGQIRRVTGE